MSDIGKPYIENNPTVMSTKPTNSGQETAFWPIKKSEA